MARVMLTFNRPYHLSTAEADAWVRTEVRRLTALEGVESIALTRPGRSRRHRRPHDWVCELELREGTPADTVLEDRLCAGWLRDLRSLGLHPAVTILGRSETVLAPARDRRRFERVGA